MKTSIIVLALVLSGCASTRIAPIGPDTYLLHRSGGGGTGSAGGAQMDALEDAGKYCSDQGKKLIVVSTQSGMSALEYDADIQFRCLAEGDKDLSRPTLQPVPSTKINIIH